MDKKDVLERAASEVMAEVQRELDRRAVPWPAREDVAQDILLWYLAHRILLLEGDPATRLVRVVVGRFLRPRNRRRYETQRLEPAVAAEGARSPDLCHAGDAKVMVREILTAFPPRERALAGLLACGMTWVEDCDALAIRPGSRNFFRKCLRSDLLRFVA
jgi:hypothetical protein